jgi:DNA (cytosine-5)-methyltransferase 1
MRVLDLFSGIGGFSLGLERAGMQTIQFVEHDKKCRQILARHWPHVSIHEDIKTYEPKTGEADVICGGFPCQRFSTANRGRKVAKDLWPHMRRIVAGVRPLWVVAENVDSIDDERPASELEELGFSVWSLEVDASPRGRRHERRRAIFVANANQSGKPRCAIHAQVAKSQSCPGRGWWDQSAPLGMDDGLFRTAGQNENVGKQLLPNCSRRNWPRHHGRRIT